MNFDSLIFDLDGTLWDCTVATANSVNLIFESYGVEKRITPHFIRTIAGRPVNECEDIIVDGIASPIRGTIKKDLAILEATLCEKSAAESLYDGVSVGLISLSKKFKLYLVSNCGVSYLESFLKFSGVGDIFEDSECLGRTLQPKGENICSVINRNRLTAACYIGDTSSDQEAATIAGIPFYHVQYGFGVPRGDVVSFATFHELVEYFLNNKF